MPAIIEVIFCADWGYASRYYTLEKEIRNKFKENIFIRGRKTSGLTGCFEVTVNNVLIHSKSNGDGFVDDEAKRNKIFTAISDALK